jgi:hypothetical protein
MMTSSKSARIHDLLDHTVVDGKLVEDELLNVSYFKEFVFTNPLRVRTSMNPTFLEGTAVEGPVADLTDRPSSGATDHSSIGSNK